MSTNLPENVTPEGEQVTGEDFDPYAVTLDDLEKKIESARHAEEESPEAPADETPVEEPEAEAAEEPEEEQASESEPEPEPEGTQATEEESTVSDEDILRARVEHAEAQAKHFETELGRKAGESGHFKQKLAELEGQMRALQQGTAQTHDEYGEAGHREPQPQPRQPQPDESLRSYVMGTAFRDGGADFFTAHPDAFVDDGNGQRVVDPEFAKAMTDSGFNPEELMVSNDPLYVRGEVTRALEATYNRVRAGRHKAHLEDLERRKSDELQKLRDKKRVSAASTGAPARARPKAVKFDPWKVSIEDLKKKVDEARESADA